MSKRPRDSDEEESLPYKMDVLRILVNPASYDYRDAITKLPFEIVSLQSFASLIWLAKGAFYSSDAAKVFAALVVEEYLKCKLLFEKESRKKEKETRSRQLFKHMWNCYRRKYIEFRGQNRF